MEAKNLLQGVIYTILKEMFNRGWMNNTLKILLCLLALQTPCKGGSSDINIFHKGTQSW